jgi:hypothetical protein
VYTIVYACLCGPVSIACALKYVHQYCKKSVCMNKLWVIIYRYEINVRKKSMWAIKNGQSRDTGNTKGQ